MESETEQVYKFLELMGADPNSYELNSREADYNIRAEIDIVIREGKIVYKRIR